MLEIIDITENPDGSATMRVNMSEDVMQMLVEKSINDILREAMNQYEDEENTELLLEVNTELSSPKYWDERAEDLEIEKHVGP